MAENINITYDILFDILRSEKSREELQLLDEHFYTHVAEYIKEKEVVLLHSQTPVAERELTRIQLGNVRKLLQELYDRRERKIITLALYKTKTHHDVIQTNHLLLEEKGFFESMNALFAEFHQTVFDQITLGKAPIHVAFEHVSPTSGQTALPTVIPDDDSAIISIRFIKPVPKFLGPELESYGPFEPEDIASLPSRIAQILLGKGRAERIAI
ncbi:MAG: hypothetical protein WC916_06220 [Candidatus Woesearchaeota archaeon]